jgi:tRNA-dihydrouridine synthase
MSSETLRRHIDRFLKRTGCAPTTLGRQAMGDPSFVAELRDGRRVWPDTEKKVRAWIREYEARATDPQQEAA